MLKTRVCIVTGGSSGIGESTVRRFHAEGASVVISDIQEAKGRALAQELNNSSAGEPRASFFKCDVSDESDVQALVGFAEQTYGGLDVMFNNAGFGGVPGNDIADIDTDGYDKTTAVLLRGPFLGMKYAASAMKRLNRGGGGSIINTASIAGILAGNGSTIYAMCKGALIHFTKVAAVPLGPHNIRVNAICPGAIMTPLMVGAGANLNKTAGNTSAVPAMALEEVVQRRMEERYSRLTLDQPIRRGGLPEDIAKAALYLASDMSSFVTGHALVVDGGMTAGFDRAAQFEESVRLAMDEPKIRKLRELGAGRSLSATEVNQKRQLLQAWDLARL